MHIELSPEPVLDTPADLLVVGTDAGLEGLDALDTRLHGELVRYLRDSRFKPKAGDHRTVPSFGQLPAQRLAIVGIGDRSSDDLRAAAAAIGKLARAEGLRHLAVDLGTLTQGAVADVIEGLSYGNYLWDAYQPEAKRKPALSKVSLHRATASDAAVSGALRLARWQSFTRDLVNLPADALYPASLAERAAEHAAQLPGVEIEVWDHDRCASEGLVGIEAVGRASTRQGCLIHLTYRPEAPKDHIALVGKGVTFDSGGLSLKPSSAMQTMRCDMGGAATVLGAFFAVADAGLPISVDCFVPAVENMINGSSYKLGDILTYRNGVSVEIHNTDAEGRIVLADALCLASEVDGVSAIVDAATLTGAMVIALGPDFTGLFSADDALASSLLDAATAKGEGLWRMPLHQPYTRMLKGTWSSIKNVGGREAGSITAALFLQHFVGKDKAWAHLDIAGPAFYDRARGGYAPGGTGQMVRSLFQWAHDRSQA